MRARFSVASLLSLSSALPAFLAAAAASKKMNSLVMKGHRSGSARCGWRKEVRRRGMSLPLSILCGENGG